MATSNPDALAQMPAEIAESVAEIQAAEARFSERFLPICRFCGNRVQHLIADLGMQPVANAYRSADELMQMEPTFPLRAMICGNCLLVQAQEFETFDHLFDKDYAYFSSYSSSMLEHARLFAEGSIERFGLDKDSLVVEVASNDGYLLRWFKDVGVPVLGIEPTASTAQAAIRLGIPVESVFFGRQTAQQLLDAGHAADLMPANNVVAHVPDINDFIGGFRILLKPNGVACFEFHHVRNLLAKRQFDTIYHEHYYYHSLSTFSRILERHELSVFDVERVSTHGGSLRVYAQQADTGTHATSDRVAEVLADEHKAGLDTLEPYLRLDADIRQMKRRLLTFLIEAKNAGKTIVAYGAPAKANTLLNYAGVGTDFIDYTVDLSPHKQNKYLPGTLIPILAPERVFQTRPDYLLILVWNLTDEVHRQMAGIREWGGQFVTLIPDVTVS